MICSVTVAVKSFKEKTYIVLNLCTPYTRETTKTSYLQIYKLYIMFMHHAIFFDITCDLQELWMLWKIIEHNLLTFFGTISCVCYVWLACLKGYCCAVRTVYGTGFSSILILSSTHYWIKSNWLLVNVASLTNSCKTQFACMIANRMPLACNNC